MKLADFQSMIAPQTHVTLWSWPPRVSCQILWAGQIGQCDSQYSNYTVRKADYMPSVDNGFRIYIELPQ